MQIKVQADGWPAQCRTSEFPDELPDVDDLPLTDEQRETVTRLNANRIRYVQLYKQIYGIELDVTKIKRNEGLRYVAKLCINSLC